MLEEDHKIHDHELDDGPVEDRSTTDILCCMMFIVFWVACLGVLGLAMAQGDYSKILRPYDGGNHLIIISSFLLLIFL